MHSRRAFGSHRARLATTTSPKVIAWGRLMSPLCGGGGRIPSNYRYASKIDRVWYEKSPNLSRYILAGTAARVLVTFYTKVDSNFTSEPNSKPAKEVQIIIKSRTRSPLTCFMLCVPVDSYLVHIFHFTWTGQPTPSPRPTNPGYRVCLAALQTHKKRCITARANYAKLVFLACP